MSESKREILKKVKKATVAVGYLNTADSDEPFTILGSGFCIDPTGIVVTCRHVVEGFLSKTIAQQVSEAPPSRRPNGIQPVSPGNTTTPYAIFYDAARSSKHIFAILSHPRNLIAKTDKDLAAIQLLPHARFPQGYPFLEIEEFGNISDRQPSLQTTWHGYEFLHQRHTKLNNSWPERQAGVLRPHAKLI